MICLLDAAIRPDDIIAGCRQRLAVRGEGQAEEARMIPVRQGQTDEQGNPTWLPGGAKSLERVFSWMSVAVPETPSP